MKNWKKLRIVTRSFLLALAGILAFAGVAMALVVLFSVPADINITPGSTDAELFLDPAATIPVPAVHWGDVQRGSHIQLDLYLKNTGVEPITATLTIPEDMSLIMTYSFTPASIPLNAGEVGHFLFEADILPTAPLGLQNYSYEGNTP